jgi:hypothetical protein
VKRKVFVTLTTVFLILLLGSLLAACGGAPQEAAPVGLDGQALLAERCSECHDLGRVERVAKTEAEWKSTVERMVGKGAELDQAEQQAVIQHLVETYGP